ncbi:MAG TPA: alpha/beta hydrolase [Stellaceae bacterium]|jgi:pimeloyl-ACP methyl ester carboxylesterase|nr:alpha/beta hydrolase [Stellaceae bacterium]
MNDVPRPLAVVDAVSGDGAVLRLRRHGNPQAATRLFMSHGNGFAIDGYADFWSRFLGDFDIVAFDMRNHGQNPLGDPAHHNYAQMTHDIAAVGRAARAEFGAKPEVGVFHSMSAQSALLQVLAGEPRFDLLILFDPPNTPPEGHPAAAPMLAYLRRLVAWASQRRDRFAAPADLAAEYAATRSGRRWVAGADRLGARSVLRADGDEWRLTCPRDLEASMYRQGITLNLWPRRCDVAVPVTLIGADPDASYPAATGLSNRALAAEGGFAYRTIRGTSHLAQFEEPAACAAIVLDILRQTGL